MKETVTIKLPRPIKDQLDQYLRSRQDKTGLRTTVSSVISVAIAEWLERQRRGGK